MTRPPTESAGRGPGDRIHLAQALAEARRRLGLSGAEAGRRAGMSQSKISKIERGYLLPSPEDVEALGRLYELSSEERSRLVAIATGLRAESRTRIILTRRVAEFQRRIGELERSASLIRTFQPTMVIGLLQTAAYMRCVFGTPDSQALSGQEVDEAVQAREHRQRVLADPSKTFVLIMSEGALRWQAGSAAVMAEQAHELADAAVQLPNARIGIVPWTQPMRFFPRHGFHLYDDDAVIVGTETATATITGEADIAMYVELFEALEELAVFGEEAQRHFARIARDYWDLHASYA
jgi:transcriptional regulator with XRE-family HTH domain